MSKPQSVKSCARPDTVLSSISWTSSRTKQSSYPTIYENCYKPFLQLVRHGPNSTQFHPPFIHPTHPLIITSQQTIARHYARIIQQWPHDPLRPTVSFTKLLEKRAANAAAKSGTVTEQQAELRNVNALYSLLDDRYTKKVRMRSNIAALHSLAGEGERRR